MINEITLNEIGIFINVGTILFFAGAWWQLTKHNEKVIEELKAAAEKQENSFQESINHIKDNFENKLASMKVSFGDTLKQIKEFYNEKLSDLKENIKENIENNARHTAEHIARLEEKQDKHNGLYDTVIETKQSVKSAHHRIDELTGNFR